MPARARCVCVSPLLLVAADVGHVAASTALVHRSYTVFTLTVLTLAVTPQGICQESLHQIQVGGLLQTMKVLLTGCEQHNKQTQVPTAAQATLSNGPCPAMFLEDCISDTMDVCLCRDTSTGTSRCFQALAKAQLQAKPCGKLYALLHALKSAVRPLAGRWILEQADAYRPWPKPSCKQLLVESSSLCFSFSQLLYALLQGDEYWNQQMLSGPCQGPIPSSCLWKASCSPR